MVVVVVTLGVTLHPHQPPELSSQPGLLALMRTPEAEKVAGWDPPAPAGGLTGPDRGLSGGASCSHQALAHGSGNILPVGWLSQEDERPRARVQKLPGESRREEAALL